MAVAFPRIVLVGLTALALTACTYQALQLTVSLDEEGPAKGDEDAGDPRAPSDAPPGDGSPGDPKGPGDLLPVGDTMPPGDPTPYDDFTPACVDPEGADSPTLASPIAPGTSGSLCTADQDWYRVAASANDVLALSVTLSDSAVVEVAVQLCSSGQAVGRCPAATVGGTWRCEFRPETDSDLCVGLWLGNANPHATTQYSLSAAVSQPLCAVDTYEENDARSSPYPASSEQRTLEYAVLCPNDPDWFRFETSSDDDALLVEVQSFSPTSLLVDAADCTGTGDLPNTVCRWHPVETGLYQCALHFAAPLPAYCVQVFSDVTLAAAGAPYQLAVRGILPCGDDPAEPNNHPDAATPLVEVGGESLQICELDVDWLSVGPVTSTSAIFRLRWYDPESAITLEATWCEVGGNGTSNCTPACPSQTTDGDYRERFCMKTISIDKTYRVGVSVWSAPPGIDVAYTLSVTF